RADARLLEAGDGVFKILHFEGRKSKIENRRTRRWTRFRSGAAAFQFRISSFEFRVSSFEFRASSFELRVSNLREGPVQLLPQAQLQLARRLSGEGDSHHVLDRGQPFLQDRN